MSARPPLTADAMLGPRAPDPSEQLSGPDLVRVYWLLRGRAQEITRQAAFWEANHQALTDAYAELAERTRELAQARQRISELDSLWLRFGDRAIHAVTGERRGPGAVAAVLPTKELELLRYLIARPDQAVSREDLYRDVWGYAPGVQSRTLDVHVRRLRVHLEVDPARPDRLRTEPGVGYRFVPPAGFVQPGA